MIFKLILLILVNSQIFRVSFINETHWELTKHRRLTNGTKECVYLNLFC